MGGECLRTTLSLYTEMWSACEKHQNFNFQTSNIKNEKIYIETHRRDCHHHPYGYRYYAGHAVVHGMKNPPVIEDNIGQHGTTFPPPSNEVPPTHRKKVVLSCPKLSLKYAGARSRAWDKAPTQPPRGEGADGQKSSKI